jgi:exodeoxyribonuclease V beta subunit
VASALAHESRVDAATLTRGLVETLLTPLGPLAGGRRLADVPPSDRLSELGFEMPLAGGDRVGRGGSSQSADAALADVAALLRQHLPADDPLRDYADALEADELGGRRLRGYLLGSIDAVLRIPHPQVAGEQAYLVVDYKTNVLRDIVGTINPWGYRPPALVPAMVAAHYPLQALLYAVALHRFLRWRLGRRYDPALHLGGVQYHFVRGMVGPDAQLRDTAGDLTGDVCGVLAWALPAPLVVAVSQLLADGGGAP